MDASTALLLISPSDSNRHQWFILLWQPNHRSNVMVENCFPKTSAVQINASKVGICKVSAGKIRLPKFRIGELGTIEVGTGKICIS